MEIQFETQWQLGNMIDRFLANIKKDGPSRRRKSSYISGHLETITKYWAEFEEKHSELVLSGVTEHQYFQEGFYDQVKSAYDMAIKILHEDKESLSSKDAAEETQGDTPLKTMATNQITESPAAASIKMQEDTVKASTSTREQQITGKFTATAGKFTLRCADDINQAQPLRYKRHSEDDINQTQSLRYKRLEVRYNSLDKHVEELQNAMHQSQRKSYYQLKKTALQAVWEKIAVLHEEIAIHEEDTTRADEHWHNLDMMERKFQETMLILEEKLTDSESSQLEDHGVRLPRVSIPIFEGNYKTWMSFHDIYVKMIHSQAQLGNAVKMQYLKCNIRGEASRLIQHLEISGDNYEAAWNLLCNRYNNKRLLINTHLDNLLNEPAIVKESSQELKRLHDRIREAVQGVQSLKIDTSTWGPILVHIITKKLDKETFNLYEQSLNDPKNIPSFEELLSFIENRFQSLESIETSSRKKEPERKPLIHKNNFQSYRTYHTTLTVKCIFCGGNHSSFKCAKQQTMTIKEKLEIVRKNKLCTNCLRKGHEVNNCTSRGTCSRCQLKHNTLLHEEKTSHAQLQGQASGVVTMFSTKTERTSSVLLATAIVKIEANNGTSQTIKALIDQGSQASFITERLAQNLGLKREKTNVTVSGIHSQKKSSAFSRAVVKISPRFNSKYEVTVTTFVLNKFNNLIPEITSNTANWHYIEGIVLADPEFHKQGKIDIILGADVYGDIIMDGVLKGPEGCPIAQQTTLGWIISGRCGSTINGNITSMVATIDLQEIKRFWEIEEIPEQRELTSEERNCIQNYESSVARDKTGRYIVRLPFKDNTRPTQLNDNKGMAISRLLHMEKRFKKDKQLELEYKDFMRKYLELGHMNSCKSKNNPEQYFLPHHAVIKHDSKTTKLRVVFDGSAKTSKGESLNSMLHTGPQLQPELFDILIQWRRYKFVFKADIEKMFRQILVHEDDQRFQKILWRFSETDPIQEYKLTTVTYGTRPAPFLAVKTMQHLAEQHSTIYPNGAKIIFKNFYMDDLLAGSNTIEGARLAIYEVTHILNKAGFNLRQWSSNDKKILRDIPATTIETESTEFNFTDSVKTLGLHWNPYGDYFTFKVNTSIIQLEPTKRSLLSETSRLFDPIGWLAPLILKAKLMFQKLWELELNWDDKLPVEIASRWLEYQRDLPLIERLKIPRWIHCKTKSSPSEIHGFSDASEKAYSAVIYIRGYDEAGNITINLITARTKVAPSNKKTSLPRLELCGALLLAKLIRRVVTKIDLPCARTYAWTDSEIVIAWLNGNPSKYKTFVANRVSKIQSVLNQTNWLHVNSKENPADCASRGLSAAELLNHKLWWNGPDWLKNWNYKTEHKPVKETEVERRTAVMFTTLIQNKFTIETIERFSSIERASRIFGYCLRFIKNCQGKELSGPLTITELQESSYIIIRAVQREEFPNEYTALTRKQPVNSKSLLLSLNPFIDNNGLIRVGGRLENADLEYSTKHPIVLPYKGHFTKLIILDAHKKTMHGGVNLTLSYTRNKYWILKGYSAIKQLLRSCVRCARYNARVQEQLMGNLPRARLNITRPFTNAGVDYAGPLTIKLTKGRGSRMCKGYIAAFICLATKALHLEAVSDLTAEAFIAAFKRFVARRGIPSKIYSDNATNFQLANKILKKNEEEFKKQYQDKLLNELQNQEIEWSFIPPAAPHFGGIWEAGIKSLKQHLKRTLGETMLTFEELSTILASIEACLNSRPLCPMTDDPSDLSVLTPAHFLVGSSLLVPPGKDLEDRNACLRSRWKLLDHLHQQIWKKWSREYLHRLQCRPKWSTRKENVQFNDLVLLKDEMLPPGQWPLGRIMETHPGPDGMVRVVTIRTKNKLIKRPVTKVCLLPVNDPEVNNKPLTKKSREEDITREPSTKRQRRVNPVSGYPNLITDNNTKERNPQLNHSRKTSTASGRQKLGNFTLLVLLAIFLVPVLAHNSQPFEITPLKSHPGIYFEELGETQLIASEWNIFTYYDLQNYWKELSGIRNCITEIHNLCNATTIRKNMCLEIFEQFKRQYNQIEEANELIHKHGVSKQAYLRQRRSPLNIVGKAANLLFGVLDTDYANYVDDKLGKIHKNEEHLLQLIKNQTSIVETTVNVLKGRDESIQTQFKIIKDHIQDITTQIHHGKEDQESLQLFNILTIHTTLVLSNYERTQASILAVLMDLHHGRINPLLITPAQLRSQIQLIRQNIPSSLALPENGPTTDLLLYGLMTAAVRVMESRILFKINLPLLQNEKYQLFHLVPAPTAHEGHLIFIEPETPYLIVNLHRDNYYPLAQFELDKCINIEERRYFCQKNHPVYNSNADRGKCEINLLKHTEGISPSCRIRSVKPSKIWIQLKEYNTWLYILDKEYTFNIVCGTSVTSKNLHGEGILKLTSGCEIKEESMTISGHGVYTTELNSSFIPSFNLSELMSEFQKQPSEPPAKIQHWHPSHQDYDTISKKISKLQQEEKLEEPLSSHDIHHYAISYLLLIFTISIVCFLLFKFISSRRSTIKISQESTKPTPAARSWKLSPELHI